MTFSSKDVDTLPKELQLMRTNNHNDITRATHIVGRYMPIPDFGIHTSNETSTTVISAFYPPPPGEHILRTGAFKGSRPLALDEYIDGLEIMASVSQYLIVFVPPGQYAERLRGLELANVAVFDHYKRVWDIPHLQGKESEFYNHQVELLSSAYRPGQFHYGEPHSWASWNVKDFLILEALKLDLFRTSHFAWLDARVPGYVGIDLDNPQMAVGWPHPRSIKNVLGSIESYPKQSAVVLAFDRSLRPVDTPYWPALMENGTRLDSYMSDIHSIYGGLFLGSKASLARLARSLLIFMERDLARGYYIGREEFQLSYAHYEFCDIARVLELFKMNPRTGLKYSRPFNLFNSPDTNFTDLGPFAAPTSRVCMADHDSLSLPNRLGYLYFHVNDFILLCTMMLISFFCLSRFLKSTMGY